MYDDEEEEDEEVVAEIDELIRLPGVPSVIALVTVTLEALVADDIFDVMATTGDVVVSTVPLLVITICSCTFDPPPFADATIGDDFRLLVPIGSGCFTFDAPLPPFTFISFGTASFTSKPSLSLITIGMLLMSNFSSVPSSPFMVVAMVSADSRFFFSGMDELDGGFCCCSVVTYRAVMLVTEEVVVSPEGGMCSSFPDASAEVTSSIVCRCRFRGLMLFDEELLALLLCAAPFTTTDGEDVRQLETGCADEALASPSSSFAEVVF